MLGLGIVPNNEKKWFQVGSDPSFFSDNYDTDNLLYSVVFNLKKEVIHHDRSIYTFLDLLGDIGGLFDALKGIFSILITLNFYIFGDPLHSFLLKSLFYKNFESTS